MIIKIHFTSKLQSVQVHKNKFFLYGEALLSKSIISLSYVQYFHVAIIIVCTKQIHGHTESSTNMHFVLNQKQTLSWDRTYQYGLP